MVIGDPYNIAVFYEEIREWNLDDEFKNGVLLFFIDGDIFLMILVTSGQDS